MANHASSKKRIRQIKVRTQVNRTRLSEIRTFIRKVDEAVAAGDRGAAQTALKEVQPLIMKGAQRGVMHQNTAARKLSRLARRVNALAG